jgi:hypothetical protein
MAHNVFAALQQFDNRGMLRYRGAFTGAAPFWSVNLDQRIDVAEQPWQAW